MQQSKILVVDDEPGAQEVLKDFLAAKGYVVLTASSGPEALRVVQQHRPHLIFLDIQMPGMDGVEALKRIREIDPQVGVIMVTAVGEEKIAQAAMSQGAYDYITKPIDFGYLEVSLLTRLAQPDR